ncbi:RmlC-like jelly roll fold, partial [Lasallia pustulata]
MTPEVSIVKYHEPLETLKVGPITLFVLEDGTNSSTRISAVLIHLPPKTQGPPPHWHEMHDETFLVTK